MSEAVRFEMATIYPVVVIGPSVCSGDGFSEGILIKMLDGTNEKIDRFYWPFVDIRDVALAHVRAI